MAPAPVLFAALTGISLWRRHGSPQARGMVAFLAVFAGLNTLLTVLLFGDPFVRSLQFVYCWLIAALIAAGTLFADRQRQVVMALAVLALGCVALRVNRYLEVAQSWAARDPRPVEAFLRAHVPPGSTVYTESPYYFALHSVGLRARAYIWVRLPWYATGTVEPFTPATPRFLVLPDPDPEVNNPPRAKSECLAAATLVAVFEPAPVPATGILSRLPVYFQPGAVRGYSRTVLYRLPDGCDLG
jgi:hypothetical protein